MSVVDDQTAKNKDTLSTSSSNSSSFLTTPSAAAAAPAPQATSTSENRSGADNALEARCRALEDELQIVRDSESNLKQQYADQQRRERLLVRRLATKEQEVQDYMLQISEYKAAQAPSPATLRNALLDPAVNILFQKLKAELQATKAKLEETQNELSAWKFTPDSNTGKRLMAKCRLLYQENEELGKMTSNGRLAKLEGDLALHRSFCDEMKKCQSDLDEFLQELDEDVEGMQSTILFLQQELKAAKDQLVALERENAQLRQQTGGQVTTEGGIGAVLVNGNGNVTTIATAESENLATDESRTRDSGGHVNGGATGVAVAAESIKRPFEETIMSVVDDQCSGAVSKRTRSAMSKMEVDDSSANGVMST